MTIRFERALGAFYGVALGDAYGRPLEFTKGGSVRLKVVLIEQGKFMWTDDTHMSMYLAEAILDIDGVFDEDRFGKAVAERFVEWRKDPLTPTTAPGNTCMSGVRAYEQTGDWRTSGVARSDGCGAVMRICPLPMAFEGDELERAAHLQAAITHGHPNAREAAISGTRILRRLLEGEILNPALISEESTHAAARGEEAATVAKALQQAVDHAARSPEWLEEESIGDGDGGWRSPSALGLALAAALQWRDEPTLAIEKAARIDGDSDSVACLAGMFLGAHHGVDAWPSDWLAVLPQRDVIEDLTSRLVGVPVDSDLEIRELISELIKSGAELKANRNPADLRKALKVRKPAGDLGDLLRILAEALDTDVLEGPEKLTVLVPPPEFFEQGLPKPKSLAEPVQARDQGGSGTQHAQPALTGDKRTSITDPIRVDWLLKDFGPGRGRVGLTFVPGKSGPSVHGKDWDRDLGTDLDRLRALYKVELLVSLIEDHELSMLNIEDYPDEASRRGIAVYRSPVVDLKTPTIEQANHIVDVSLALASAGRNVVFHCRGGLGRAGTLGACLLVSLGRSAQKAITEVRKARKGAIETASQKHFIEEFAQSKSS